MDPSHNKWLSKSKENKANSIYYSHNRRKINIDGAIWWRFFAIEGQSGQLGPRPSSRVSAKLIESP